MTAKELEQGKQLTIHNATKEQLKGFIKIRKVKHIGCIKNCKK